MMRWVRTIYYWPVCALFGHQCRHVEKVSPYSEKIQCIWCARFFGHNYASGITLPWKAVKEFHEQGNKP